MELQPHEQERKVTQNYQQLTLFRCHLARDGAEKLKNIQLFGLQIASSSASAAKAQRASDPPAIWERGPGAISKRRSGTEGRDESEKYSMYSNGRSETRFERE